MKIKTNKFFEKIRSFKPFDYFRDNPNELILLALMVLTVLVRFWSLITVPGGFSDQEEVIVGKLLAMNKDNLWLGGEYYQAGYLYLSFLWTKIFGFTILNLRILSAILGSLTVYFCYSFISKWFSKKIAIFLAFMLAISSFHIAISRLILPEILLPLLMLLLFNTLTIAYRTKNIWYFGIAGALLAMGLYTSPAFLLIPVILLLAAGYFYKKNKKFILAYKEELIISGVAFVALAIPYIVSFVAHPMAYLTFFGFNRSLYQIALNVGGSLRMMFFYVPADYFINLGSEPLFDPFIFITSVAGFFYALFRIDRRKYFFLVIWFLIILAYGALKRTVQISNLVGLIPIIYIFSALILDYLINEWFKTFPYNKFARYFLIGLVSIFFALSTMYNINRYFVAYKESAQVQAEFSKDSPVPLR